MHHLLLRLLLRLSHDITSSTTPFSPFSPFSPSDPVIASPRCDCCYFKSPEDSDRSSTRGVNGINLIEDYSVADMID